MARELESARGRRGGDLVLEFHDPLLPDMVTAAGCVIAGAICLYCSSTASSRRAQASRGRR